MNKGLVFVACNCKSKRVANPGPLPYCCAGSKPAHCIFFFFLKFHKWYNHPIVLGIETSKFLV